MEYKAQGFEVRTKLARRGPCIKNEGLVFHGTAQAIQLINSLFYGKTKI